MKNAVKMVLVLLMLSGSAFAQKYITKNGKITFFSDASLEKIEAQNNQVNTALDIATGDVVFKVLIKSFVFENALMQEHFNENYMESDKYPNATFKGKITNLSAVNFAMNGTYKADTEGDMMIHNVTKKLAQSGTIEVKDGKAIITAKFNILLKDYNVKVPGNLVNNISETIAISVNATMDLVK
jgi:hypothetical protein